MDLRRLDPAESRSRYRATPTATFTAGERTVSWRLPRILPLPDEVPTAGRPVAARAGERLDQLSTRLLGDPLAYWRLTDANPSLDPLRFVEEHGYRVGVPLLPVHR